MGETTVDTSKFRVGLGTHLLSGAMTSAPRFWDRLGQLESLVLSEQLDDIQIQNPVYVTGLARSGTTIALEVLASHSEVSTHRYCDFPALFTPYWWGKANENSKTVISERAHGDGLMVTNQSPEAMEEVLWMAHFNNLHDPQHPSILDQNDANFEFERTYRQHIKKLILLRGGPRYVAKGNYNISRLKYILSIFPDAKFVIPIRHPISHIASLQKQHRLFCAGQKDHPRSIAHLRRVGHFEFGLDRRPINLGDNKQVNEILDHWCREDEISGWSKYWSSLYGWLHRYLEESPDLKESVMVIRYEDLCCRTNETLQKVLRFTNLMDEPLVQTWSEKIKAPGYYDVQLTADELAKIHDNCIDVAKLYGYRAEGDFR